MGAAPEVQVHDPTLRSGEARRYGPPRHVELARPSAERLNESQVRGDRGNRHEARQTPDLGL